MYLGCVSRYVVKFVVSLHQCILNGDLLMHDILTMVVKCILVSAM